METDLGPTKLILGKDVGQCSDGYHTFNELYDHRNLLFINLCLVRPQWARWKLDYEGWFCLYLELPTGQISYHIQDKYLPLVKDKISQYLEGNLDGVSYYDGHTSKVVLERLMKNRWE